MLRLLRIQYSVTKNGPAWNSAPSTKVDWGFFAFESVRVSGRPLAPTLNTSAPLFISWATHPMNKGRDDSHLLRVSGGVSSYTQNPWGPLGPRPDRLHRCCASAVLLCHDQVERTFSKPPPCHTKTPPSCPSLAAAPLIFWHTRPKNSGAQVQSLAGQSQRFVRRAKCLARQPIKGSPLTLCRSVLHP